MSSSATIYNVFVNSCRWFSNKEHAVIQIKVYPDIKWTLEFNWNHTQPFAYTFGNKLHPHTLSEARKKAIGSETDRGWSENYGEMEQSFGLSLKAEWNRITQGSSKVPEKFELGHKWEAKIRKTLSIFNKIKGMTEKISNSPLAKGNIQFTIESPKIAFAAEWYLERAPKSSIELSHMVTIGVSAKPLVKADIQVDLFETFVKYGGNALCLGAGSILSWVKEKMSKEFGAKFTVNFLGSILVDGKVTINTLYPKETIGEVSATGKIEVVVEFKAWAKAEVAYLGFEGEVRANASTSVTGGIKVGADKKGIYTSPIAKFDGLKATFIAVGTVKFGMFKRTLSYEGESRIVSPDEIKFEKYYLDFSKTENK